MISQLYLKDNYINKNYELLLNKVIIEYDLKSANTSLCKEYNLLPDVMISYIESLPKKQRVIKIGKLMKKDTKFKEEIKRAFIDARKRFFEANNIQDEDILSIKKDAIFCIKRCNYTDFGKLHFASKNTYSSYMYLNRLEFYYMGNSLDMSLSKLDIKGIDDEVVKKHNDYMMKFFKQLFMHLESSNTRIQFEYIKRFIDKYKHLELEVGYYREFNQDSIIRVIDGNETYDDITFIPYEHKQEHLDIDYNFFQIILPIVQIIL